MKKKTWLIIALAVGIPAAMYLSFILGTKVGEDLFVEDLIHRYENGDELPCFESSDETFRGLIYELSATCIGD